jgi:hypothetical protein
MRRKWNGKKLDLNFMKKIKNYKLFLEGLSDDNEFKQNVDVLKRSLYAMFNPVFNMEKIIRISGNTEDLEYGTDKLIEILFSMFVDSVNRNEDLDDEFRDVILSEFDKALKSARPIFIEESFKDGVDKSINLLIEFLDAVKKAKDSEGEEWRQSKEVDYKDMSKSEINDLIDQALDARDFGEVKFLSQYLKESFEITDDMKAGIQKFCDTLVRFIVQNYYAL